MGKTAKKIKPYEILKDTGTDVDKIFHISDIHISNDRHDEFRLVFSRLFNIIRTRVGNNNDNCLIVITGDIIDSWNLSPAAKELLNEFYTEATSITSCISIPGNHEYKGLDKKYNNPLYPLIDQNFNTGNANKSYTIGENKCYLYENIIFGLTTPFADKVTPCKIKQGDLIKIGLYHGTIYNAENYQKFKFKDDSYFGCDDFSDYQYVLLGDIHKEQSMNAEKTIRYPGSLIQLKKSESPEHGFIMWEIKKGKSTFIKVPNDKVQLCIDESDNINKLDLQKYNGKNIQITLSHRSGTDKNRIKDIQNTINKKLNNSDISYETNIDYSDTRVNVDLDINGKKESLLKISNKGNAVEFIVNYMKKHYDDNMMKKIKKMLLILAKRIKHDENATINNIQIESLEFDNMFIFGNNNRIDFTKFSGLVGLNSRNGTGKSSIIDTICLSIYGTQSRGTEDMKSALKKGEKEFKTDITLLVNKERYRIVRTYKRSGNDYMKFGKCSVVIYKNNKEIKSYDKSTGWLEANKFVADNICSYNDFVNHFVILQKVNTGFSNMGKNRGDYLLDVFKLDLFNEFSNEISAEKRHISTRFASVANMLVDLNMIKKGDSQKVKDKKKLMKDEISKINQKLKELNDQKVACDAEEKDSRKLLTHSETALLSMCDYIDKYGNITNMEDMLREKITICDKARLISSKIKHAKRVIRRCNDIIAELTLNIKNCPVYEINNVNFNNQIAEMKSLIDKEFKVVSMAKIKKDLDDNKNKEKEFRHGINKIYDMIKENIISKNDAINSIEQLGYNMADDMVKINNLKNEMNLHKENEKIRDKNKIINIMINSFTIAQELIDNNNNTQNNILDFLQIKLNEVSSELKTKTTDLDTYRLELNNIKYKLEDVSDRIKKVKSMGENIDTIDVKQQKKKLSEDIKKLHTAIKNNIIRRDNVVVEQTTLNERKEQIVKCLGRYEEIEDDNNTCKAIEVMFNVNDEGNGIIEFIIRENILPYVKDIANKIFEDLNVNYSIKFNFVKKEQIELYVRKGNDVNNIDYNCTSGFESELIDIVIKYIFCQINSKVRTNFFIIDEGLKSSDKDNRENLRKIINTLKSTFKWIIAISHDDHLKDMYDMDVYINSISPTFSRIVV